MTIGNLKPLFPSYLTSVVSLRSPDDATRLHPVQHVVDGVKGESAHTAGVADREGDVWGVLVVEGVIIVTVVINEEAVEAVTLGDNEEPLWS